MCRLPSYGQGECDVLPGLRSMVGDVLGPLTPGCSSDHFAAQYLSRSSLRRRLLGRLASLGSFIFSKSEETTAATSIQEVWWQGQWEGQGWSERPDERQRARPSQGLYGPGGHGTTASATHTTSPESHGHHMDAATTALQRWQSGSSPRHGLTSGDKAPTSHGGLEKERNGVAAGRGAGPQGHVGQGWQIENQRDARRCRSFGRRPLCIGARLPRACAKPCNLEAVFAPIGPKMARVHGTFPTAGAREPLCNHSGQRGAQTSSKHVQGDAEQGVA